jgi:4'-phosphopantetheinyl transferase EntD
LDGKEKKRKSEFVQERSVAVVAIQRERESRYDCMIGGEGKHRAGWM